MKIGGVLAGGIGSRMNAGGLPKQFMAVAGVPVLVRTMRAFLSCRQIDVVVVAINDQWRERAEQLINEWFVDRSRIGIVGGGATRFDSLVSLSKFSLAHGGGDDIVLVNHDCARPFVSHRIIEDCLDAVKHYDMVTTSIPTIDTVLISKDGLKSDCVPDRKTIFLDQGPQAFRVKQFLRLVEGLSSDERGKYMEAGRLYLDKGLTVGIVQGDRTNFKLTTPFDMVLAEALIKEGEIK